MTHVWTRHFKSFSWVISSQDETERFTKRNEWKFTQVELFLRVCLKNVNEGENRNIENILTSSLNARLFEWNYFSGEMRDTHKVKYLELVKMLKRSKVFIVIKL